MSQAHPLVSVIMRARNCAPYVQASIQSILSQTFRNFELIVVNNGSTDQTVEIVDSFQKLDSRIRLLHLKEGNLAEAMNEGCRQAAGNYIAIMDADDVSLPTRLEKQVRFMESSPEIKACGTWFMSFGDGGNVEVKFPSDPSELVSSLVFFSPICNPTAMIRNSVFLQDGLSYDASFVVAEDYSFWVKVAKIGKMANLPEILLHYRRHAEQTTQQKENLIYAMSAKVHSSLLADLGIAPSEEEEKLHEQLAFGSYNISPEFVSRVEVWLMKLGAANAATGRYPAEAFSKVLGDYWFNVCSRASGYGPAYVKKFKQSSLSAGARIAPGRRIKFLVKATLKRRTF